MGQLDLLKSSDDIVSPSKGDCGNLPTTPRTFPRGAWAESTGSPTKSTARCRPSLHSMLVFVGLTGHLVFSDPAKFADFLCFGKCGGPYHPT